jgi:hypothetical protein
MEKFITYFGQKAKIVCDEKCHKAWGSNTRPKIQLSDDEDDYAYLADDELGVAPVDPKTYEGGEGKPAFKTLIGNKWCVRECERCNMSRPGEYDQPLKPHDFSKRFYNISPHTR